MTSPDGGLRLRHFETTEAYHDTVSPYLQAHEAEHNLLLGLTASLIAGEYRKMPPYLACVEEAGQVVLVLLRTPPYNLILSRPAAGADGDALLRLVAHDVYTRYGPDVPGVIASVPHAAHFARIWQGLTDRAPASTLAERIYRLERVIPPPAVPGEMRRPGPQHRDLLFTWYEAFMSEALGEHNPERVAEQLARFDGAPPDLRGLRLWVVEDEPVCLTGYTGPTPNGMRIGPVYTPPEYRRRGYASALVASVSQMLLDAGRTFCFLYTDLSNPTSNHIYQQIGYEPVCDVDQITFARPNAIA